MSSCRNSAVFEYLWPATIVGGSFIGDEPPDSSHDFICSFCHAPLIIFANFVFKEVLCSHFDFHPHFGHSLRVLEVLR